MRMTIEEARMIGQSKLKVDHALFNKSLEAARKVDGMRWEDLGPMALVLAVMGISKVNPNDPGIERELGDAVELIGRAEAEWRLDQRKERMN